ncbi:serine dehydrogenasease [Thalassospira sp. TSL5-1]|uniref:SDH family Clp fold serine proteinase n=1 Tax=Thalassospira sp. TSL5-1 TaxID=1544451 RepID=UPI0009400BD4|nr:serine dehydrogenasease [Thalassospira sp. TSL5-1]OKH89202.1 serine dehydrogenasease [Thalassospira sp. TSL5-1]
MTPDLFERSIFDLINEKARALEDCLMSDVIFYHGSIYPNYFRTFRDFVEEVALRSEREEKTISVVLRTGGGSADTTEKMVNVLRNHYEKVYFVVPDMAMSAGTIFCMSGDKIFMDYASSLGPIDPQVPTPDTGDYVPALGYLDKVTEITKKGQLEQADVVLLKSLDLAKLALFEQARDLSIDLLTDWLVNYKFRDWTVHRTTNPGQPVTPDEKATRAKQIASDLADHKRWRSHGRNLDVGKLKDLRIEIDDYTNDLNMRSAIRDYNDPLTGYVDRTRIEFYLHHHQVQS